MQNEQALTHNIQYISMFLWRNWTAQDRPKVKVASSSLARNAKHAPVPNGSSKPEHRNGVNGGSSPSRGVKLE